MIYLIIAVIVLAGWFNDDDSSKKSKHKYWDHGVSFDNHADMEDYKNANGYK